MAGELNPLSTSTEDPAAGSMGNVWHNRPNAGQDGDGSKLDEQTGGRLAGAKGLEVDPDAGAHDVALVGRAALFAKVLDDLEVSLDRNGLARMSRTGEVSCTYWQRDSRSSRLALLDLTRLFTLISVKPGRPLPNPKKA